MIEHRIPRLDVAQEIDKRDLIVRRARQRTHDELKIRRREPCPTIRLDHRRSSVSFNDARGQDLMSRPERGVVLVSPPVSRLLARARSRFCLFSMDENDDDFEN